MVERLGTGRRRPHRPQEPLPSLRRTGTGGRNRRGKESDDSPVRPRLRAVRCPHSESPLAMVLPFSAVKVWSPSATSTRDNRTQPNPTGPERQEETEEGAAPQDTTLRCGAFAVRTTVVRPAVIRTTEPGTASWSTFPASSSVYSRMVIHPPCGTLRIFPGCSGLELPLRTDTLPGSALPFTLTDSRPPGRYHRGKPTGFLPSGLDGKRTADLSRICQSLEIVTHATQHSFPKTGYSGSS